ncbi:unnamed protein product [Ceratitis capitata]|uniref:(Mediterranean fruit fly) hypothetical protein n=1 Tax=Ceratitis capitata TaxID=7213 RepID=A0A811UVD9_CERCA|nr:unnamed protein product [Ceratitis capitata]
MKSESSGKEPPKASNGNNAASGSDDYDPHLHRNVENPTTTMQTFAHFLKASIGSGVLAMPSAFANAGYITGPVLTLIIGGIAVHCLHILINSMYALCKRKRVPYMTFSEAMTIGLHDGPPIFKFVLPIATPLVDGFLAFYHFGICCVYVVFISESIKQIVDEYLVVLDYQKPENVSAIFNYCQLNAIRFGIVLYYIFATLPPISTRKPFQEISRLPIFFGTVLFAIEAVGVILAIEEKMAKPKSYIKPFGVLNVGMAIVLSLYTLLGFFGYWEYGDEALGSVTLNIPQEAV